MKEAREVIALELIRQDVGGAPEPFGFTQEELNDAQSILSALDAAGYQLLPKEFVIGPHDDIKEMRAYLWDQGLVEDFERWRQLPDSLTARSPSSSTKAQR